MRSFLSRPILLAYASLAVLRLGLLYILAPLTLPTLTSPARLLRGPAPKSVGLHYLLPSTATNNEVCKLLFTGATLGYPDPVFLGWEGHGRYNGTQSHLFKISETLAYLNTLDPSQDDDLVLLLDAFDVWLQLPATTLISRYFRAIDRQNGRLKEEGLLNEPSHDGTPINYSILFGADKLCWPRHNDKPACWSAPPNSLPNTTFGPETDADALRGRPQYLNSGSMIGPVKDVRDLFAATMDVVDKLWTKAFLMKNSDQYYFSVVWHEQEAARVRQRDLATGTGNSSLYNDTNVYEKGERTEYHFTIDQESEAFLVNAWYTEYMAWMTFNHTAEIPPSQADYDPGRLDRLQLPEDVLSTAGPYSAGVEGDGLPIEKGWKDVMLGVNTVSGEPYPLYHVTGLKVLLGWRWPRMWFHPHGEALLKAARRQRLASVRAGEEQVVAEVRGTKYLAVAGHKGNAVEALHSLDEANAKGGAWSDRGAYISWDEMCLEHEAEVFFTG